METRRPGSPARRQTRSGAEFSLRWPASRLQSSALFSVHLFERQAGGGGHRNQYRMLGAVRQAEAVRAFPGADPRGRRIGRCSQFHNSVRRRSSANTCSYAIRAR